MSAESLPGLRIYLAVSNACPVALFPASSGREKISFNQINKKTGNLPKKEIPLPGMSALD
jgi:hypothetical protein